MLCAVIHSRKTTTSSQLNRFFELKRGALRLVVVASEELVAPTCCWSLTTSSSEATSMSDATSVLFGLEHEFSVLEVRRVDAITVGQPGRLRSR